MCFTPLFTVKLLYFTWFGASSCLLPFLSLHMRTLGVPMLESSIISGILPLLQLLTCSLACLIPTQSATYKKTVLWCLLFTAIAALFLVFTPVVPTASKKTVAMHFQCGPDTQPSVIMDRCNHDCEGGELLQAGIEAFFTECHVDCPNRSGRFKNTADLCFDDKHGRVCHVVEVNNTLSENFIFGIYMKGGTRKEKDECLHTMDGVLWHQQYYHHVSCPIILKESNSKCVLKCDLQEVPKEDQSISGVRNCLEDSPDSVKFSIWVYFGLRALFHVCLQVASILCEKTLVCYVKAERKDVKKYRFWSHIATGIATPLAGYVIGMESLTTDPVSNYKLLFLSFFGLVLLTIVLFSSIYIDGPTLPSSKQTIRHVSQLMKEPEIDTLLAVVLLLGVVTGFLDTFLFWHLEDLSCPYYIMGLTVTVGLPVGLVFMTEKCSRIVGKISPGNLVTACLVLQSLRCLGYFATVSYWWCLMLELFGALAFHIMWAAVSVYARVVIPREHDKDFRSFACATHYGLAKGCGVAAGGICVMIFGFPRTFLGFGSSSGALGIFYFILYHLVLKRLPKNLLKDKKNPRNLRSGDGGGEENVASLLKSPLSSSNAENDSPSAAADDSSNARTQLNPDNLPVDGAELA